MVLVCAELSLLYIFIIYLLSNFSGRTFCQMYSNIEHLVSDAHIGIMYNDVHYKLL